MRKFLKPAAIFCLFALALGLAYGIAGDTYLPEFVYVSEGESFSFAGGLLTARRSVPQLAEVSSSGEGSGSSYNATLMLLGTLPLKSVRVIQTGRIWLKPGGMTFGVKMFTEGVVVVGFSKVRSAGVSLSPAEEAGLKLGDVISRVDGVLIDGNSKLAAVVEAGGGRALKVEYSREGETATAWLKPAPAADGTGYKAGMWVRDSSAGIGTVTFFCEETGVLAGLGHGVTDTDTGVIMPLSSGELVPVSVTGVVKGQSGAAGELKGAFSRGEPLATLEYNCQSGVYGRLLAEETSFGAALPAAYKQDIISGKAMILCTVDGGGPAYYDIEIESINLSGAQPSKNIVLRVTDEELLELTGGIVQGMSGSPIIQNGCIIGAVTHVFLNDPTRGYGIFIENMLAAAGELEKQALAG
ncbi:MAG: SpoIVB peptidase [Oscillospiraceae bacterium]|nr:SpoIVB peptidase [Oscillospiraceae bacterium]